MRLSWRGNELNAYVCSGVWSDHECSDAGEALEKLGRTVDHDKGGHGCQEPGGTYAPV